MGMGEEELIILSNNQLWPYQWSPDGRYLLYFDIITGTMTSDLSMFSFDEHKPSKMLPSRFTSVDAVVSPDGRWVAYVTNESGRYEIYLTTFPPSGTKLSVTTENAADELWSADRKRMFYVNTNTRELQSIDVKPGNPPEFSGRRRIHAGPLDWSSAHSYDIDAGRQRVLVQTSTAPQSEITVLLHWTALVKK
jgi:Tol biopolymer transport system component